MDSDGPLAARPVPVDAAAASLPAASGLYAWWAPMEVFDDLPGPSHPADPSVRLLYIGIAGNLRGRITGDHLRRSGSSTFRRTLAGLLLESERFTTKWTDRVVLESADEIRLTAWIRRNLLLNWIEHAEPGRLETRLITRLHPPLNLAEAEPGPAYDRVARARAAYRASAGPRPTA
ncbi:hypothetical protein GCM10027447_36360 [Glycomyces halotolerans]